MGYDALFERLMGEPANLVRLISDIRLGYEIVKLVDGPETKPLVRLSARDDSGIGIDSDLPTTFLPQGLEDLKLFGRPIFGDYHNWSTFNSSWGPVSFSGSHQISEELYYRVHHLMSDDEIATEGATVKKDEIHPVSGKTVTVEVASPAFDFLRLRRSRNEGTPYIPDRTIDFLSDNPRWREDAKTYCRLLMEQKLEYFQRKKQSMLEGMADQIGPRKFPETAVPAYNAINELFQLYISQMQPNAHK